MKTLKLRQDLSSVVMQLTRSDITDALKLRAFVLKFNMSQVKSLPEQKRAIEELDAIATRLFDEDCIRLKLSTFVSNPPPVEDKSEYNSNPFIADSCNHFSVLPNNQSYSLNVTQATSI